MSPSRSRLLCAVLFEDMGRAIIPRVPSASWPDERDRLVWATLEKLHASGRPTDAAAVSASLRRLNPWVVNYLRAVAVAGWPFDDREPITLLFVLLHLFEAGTRDDKKRRPGPRWVPLGPRPLWTEGERQACAKQMNALLELRNAEARRP